MRLLCLGPLFASLIAITSATKPETVEEAGRQDFSQFICAHVHQFHAPRADRRL